MTRPTRVLALLLAFTALSLAPVGCKKGADSVGPDGGGGSGEVAGGIDVRYKSAAFKLKQDSKFALKITSPQGVDEASLDVSGLLDVTPSGADKLKVAFAVTEVRAVNLSGNMQPKPKEGEAPIDPKAALLKATGAEIVDLKGDVDKDATKALPETAAAKDKKGAEALGAGLASSFLGLPPQLPKQALAEGTPVKVSKQEKQPTPIGMELDMDSSTTFTLVKVDSSSGKRVAEIKFESESSGAREEGKMMISAEVASEGTLWFNLDDQLPTALKLTSTYSMSFGTEGEAEFRTSLESNFAPA
jgi:hypothetical protein